MQHHHREAQMSKFLEAYKALSASTARSDVNATLLSIITGTCTREDACQ